ncbi:la protein 1 isoform X1 [Durio zibethinus]|uniref:La protein 1 isoform X1 n=1 Tax=Durio zibethinus TaxID=66656 RepID=A0A6P5ZPU8_DURZI|nr:la protein 1 isoform X1 [Durio zibethinus]XP_022754563.1 la protein 1 isoform X1 [Durio zibethinus]XP_022754564.1 la protein 1 isoform X1 [Durio zibethinus]XP_022754565.1 la protein 1 isoform X1 [Durio zibethinus]
MATPSLSEDTAKAVLRQVEFYFSDSNIPRDDFLKKKISESEDGMVSLALICSFSKMRGHLNLKAVKADDVPEVTLKAVAETLRTSSSLKVSEDGKKVGRSTDLLDPDEMIEQLDSRTVAASPFEYNVQREDVEAFFGKYAKVNSVRLPGHVTHKKYFCGTALIEFSAEEDAQRFLEQSLVFAGAELELKPKKDFDALREEEEEAADVGDYDSNVEEKYPKGLLVAFTLKSISAGDSQEQNVSDELTKEGATGSEQKTTENDNDSKEKIDDKHKSTASVYKDDMNVVLREDLKDVFQKFGTVKYVDFKVGEDKGYIRFDAPEAAQKARAAAVLAKEGGLVVKNFIANLEPVTGDAEREYWSLLRGNQEKHRENKRFQSRLLRGGKHYKGGKHARGRENDSSRGRPNKAKRSGSA